MTGKRNFLTVIYAALIFVFLSAGFVQAAENPYSALISGREQLGFKPSGKFIDQIYWFIKEKYIYPVPDKKIFGGVKNELQLLAKASKENPAAVNEMPADSKILGSFRKKYPAIDRDLAYYACGLGMVKSLNDKESEIILPSKSKDPKKDLVPQGYVGLAVLIEERNKEIILIHAFDKGPAQKAGLKPGDVFINIDGKSTAGMTLDEALARITGKPGSTANLTVKRNGKLITVKAEREEVKINPVHAGIDKNGVGYIKVVYCSMDFPLNAVSALETFKKRGVKKWILDLRDNSGGAINAVINFGGVFIEMKKPVMYIQYRSEKKKFPSNFAKNYTPPAAIIVNKYTTGSAEIIAATLDEEKGSRIYGQTTNGNTMVSEYFNLEGGATLRLAIGEILTATGRPLNGKGLKPDVSIPGADNPANGDMIIERVLKEISR